MTIHMMNKALCTLLSLAVLFGPLNAAASEITFVHPDHLGSPVAYTDINANLVGQEFYTPYGETLNGSSDDDISFTGHYKDADTGLIYAQARYYDPVVGRFLSVDPVTFSPDKPQQFNRYWYANGNPYKYADPDGNFALVALVGVATVLLVAAAISTPQGQETTGQAVEQGIENFKGNVEWISGLLLNETKGSESSQDNWKGDNPDERKGRVNTDRTSDPDKDWEEEFGGTSEVKSDGTKISPNGERFREGKDGEGPRIDIPAKSSGNSKHETIHYPPRDEMK